MLQPHRSTMHNVNTSGYHCFFYLAKVVYNCTGVATHLYNTKSSVPCKAHASLYQHQRDKVGCGGRGVVDITNVDLEVQPTNSQGPGGLGMSRLDCIVIRAAS
jgi:hypothetical protein